jgi:hypothetical protein
MSRGSDPHATRTQVRGRRRHGVYRHLEAFQQIADENGGNRASGLPGYEASAQYVTDQLEVVGYDVEWQEFDFPFYEELSPTTFRQVSPNETTYEDRVDFITMTFSGSGDVEGEVVPVDLELGTGGSTSGCEAEDFADFTAGSVALIQRGHVRLRAEGSERRGCRSDRRRHLQLRDSRCDRGLRRHTRRPGRRHPRSGHVVRRRRRAGRDAGRGRADRH